MVLSQQHPHSRAHAAQTLIRIADLDIPRIFGMAGAISLNFLAMLLLMVPVTAPSLPQAAPDETPPPDWITPKKPEPLPPPPLVKVTPPPKTVATTVARVVKPIVPPVNTQPVVIPDGNTAVGPVKDDVVITPPDVVDITPQPQPQPSTRLEYASAPAPAYPALAQRNGIEGTVYLKVLVDVDGKPLDVAISRSSGNRDLDEAARRQVLRKWRFRPAIKDGVAIQVYGIVPVNFSLQ